MHEQPARQPIPQGVSHQGTSHSAAQPRPYPEAEPLWPDESDFEYGRAVSASQKRVPISHHQPNGQPTHGPQVSEPLVNVTVQLAGRDGNAFSILATVRQALCRAGHHELAVEFVAEATSSDYNHLLLTCMLFVHVE